MNSQAIASVAVLVGLQLLVLRASQHAIRSLYFTTSSLFDRRADVLGGAVLFRMVVPVVAGALAALLAPDEEFLVGAVSGGLCWFLIIWPIIWNPRLVSHRLSLPFVVILAVFWLAYAAAPLIGVLVVNAISEIVSGEAPEWQKQFAWALFTGITISAAVGVVTRFAGMRLSFVDDSQQASDPAPEAWMDDYLDDRDYPTIIGAIALVGTAVGVVLIALVRRARKHRHEGD